ncbi:hypothetical protein [Achromobacter sp. UBA4530]|uniref:hypothetical protein n=1 Tax=Achromobacter sp. UBA4530 TaxID=1945912 RepID=UPI00257DC4C9|nr:hypothetical protein [Achromobacter sp. UBA4530]
MKPILENLAQTSCAMGWRAFAPACFSTGTLFHRHAFPPARFSTGTLFHRHAFPTASFSTGDAIGNASPPATLCAGPKLAPLLSA